MSDYRTRYGYIAVISKPMTEEEREKFNSEDFGVNYEGTLIYSKPFDKESHEFEMLLGDPEGKIKFMQTHFLLGLSVIHPYLVTWYDGADCPLDELTVKQYMGRFYGNV